MRPLVAPSQPSTMLGVVVGLLLGVACFSAPVRADEGSATQRLSVAVLPLSAGEGMTLKEARGATVMLREELERSGLVTLKKARKDDDRAARDCIVRGEPSAECLGEAAFSRGVDLIAAGFARGHDDGFVIELVVVETRGRDVLRTVEEPVVGDTASIQRGLERAARRAFTPEALAGFLVVEGRPEGALVLLDGERVAKLPLDEPIGPVVEGEHQLEVRARGYDALKRPVDIVYRETTRVETILSRSRDAQLDEALARRENEKKGFEMPIAPAALLGGGVALAVGGAVLGVFAMLDGLEVEARAASQQLVFPRDEFLYRRGQILAYSATGLYCLAAVSAATGGVLFALPIFLPGDDPYALEEGER